MSFLRTSSGAATPVVTPQYTGLQIQTSSSALPIPIVYGTNRLAPNLIWADDFQSHAQYATQQPTTGKGSLFGGGQGDQTSVSGYTYSTAAVFGVCEGPAGSILSVFNGRRRHPLSHFNLSFLDGATPQAAWGYLTASYPGQALGYQGTALAVSSSFNLGAGASIGTLSFELAGVLAASSPVNGADADPAQVIADFLTNAQYGVGFPAASIAASSLFGTSGDASYQSYCAASGLAVSPCLANQEAANATLARWLQLTNATAVWSGGLLKIIPYGDAPIAAAAQPASEVFTIFSPFIVQVAPAGRFVADAGVTYANGNPLTLVGGSPHQGQYAVAAGLYTFAQGDARQQVTIAYTATAAAAFTPNTSPVYDLADDDFLHEDGQDPVLVTRADPYAAPNVQHLEMLDRSNRYSATPIEARDQNAIEATGLRLGSTITAHEICDAAVASVAAQLILQRGLYIRNTYAFRLSWECCLLEPMDIVTLTDANLGLAKTPVRIVEIEEDAGGLLSVLAEEYPGAIGVAPAYLVGSAGGNAIDLDVVPAPINPPVILEPPADLTKGVPQLWVGLSGGSGGIADPNWGGAAVYASTDNASYTQVGAVSAPSRQGVLTASIGTLPGAPSDTLAVGFAESGATVTAGAKPVLIVVDGEFISFSSATLTGPNAYALGGLKRALYGGRGLAHAGGAQVLILDAALFTYTLPAAYIGLPLWLKFASVNTFGGGLQDLATCTAYPVTPVGSGLFGPISQAIATGTSLDEGLVSTIVNETDDDGLASDLYTDTIDMGLASEAAAAMALQNGGTGASTAAGARGNLGAAAAGANADITSLSSLTTPLSVAQGGTGASSGAAARASLGAAASGANADITSLLSVLKLQGGATQSLTIDPATGHVGLAGYTADSTNALGVSGTSCLFAATTDSMRVTFSKVAAANDATLTFQTNFSTRAIFGITGSDQLQLKVSPDGATYWQVFVCDGATGNAAFKALIGAAVYTVAALPSGFNGAIAFASNGRKTGEGAGTGTGVLVVYSNGQWRRLADDSAVAS